MAFLPGHLKITFYSIHEGRKNSRKIFARFNVVKNWEERDLAFVHLRRGYTIHKCQRKTNLSKGLIPFVQLNDGAKRNFSLKQTEDLMWNRVIYPGYADFQSSFYQFNQISASFDKSICDNYSFFISRTNIKNDDFNQLCSIHILKCGSGEYLSMVILHDDNIDCLSGDDESAQHLVQI